MQLVRGDIEVAATCTVTYIDPKQLLACGHPVLGAGPVSLPMTTSDVVATVASPLNAFKIVNTGQTIGVFNEDRESAIHGLFGVPARMIPMHAERLGQDAPTLFFGSPTFYATLLAVGLPADTFAGVRLCASAGEALPAALYRRFTSRFGVDILDGIGSTEALHIFLSNQEGAVRPGTSGVPVPGYGIELRDEDGAPVPDGTPGALFVRGDSIASGYWCRTDATRAVFQGEWLRTGDTYVRSADGYYTCLGRSDDLLKAGGIWVSPAEVEDRLLQHPAVAQVAVVAVPDSNELDKPVACVVLAAGADVSAADLIQWCRDGLAAFKRPRAVLLVDDLPKTATGKVQRFRLREFARDRLASGSTPALSG